MSTGYDIDEAITMTRGNINEAMEDLTALGRCEALAANFDSSLLTQRILVNLTALVAEVQLKLAQRDAQAHQLAQRVSDLEGQIQAIHADDSEAFVRAFDSLVVHEPALTLEGLQAMFDATAAHCDSCGHTIGHTIGHAVDFPDGCSRICGICLDEDFSEVEIAVAVAEVA